jgi:rsbT co-antagonist protein RsbR
VGQNVFALFGDTGPAAETIRAALRGQPGANTSEAGPTHWDTWYIPMRGEGGEIAGAIGLSIDATERALVEKELRGKLALIEEQELAIRSLSTPIIQVWDEVLALPLLGTLDGPRTERILDTLLDAVVAAQARYAILDLTGIATIDATTAHHLNKVMRALSLLGTISVMTGIQPAVAEALVSLDADLSQVITLGNLREAIRFVMRGMAAQEASRPVRGGR